MRVKVHPTFDPLPLPVRLRVPATLRRDIEPPPVRPAGTRVGAGERLTESASQLDHWPLAPVPATIVGPATVTLSNGRLVPAIEVATIDTTAADANVPPSVDFAGPVPMPSDRGGWIDRFRELGLWADRWTSPNLLAQLHESLRRPVDTVVCSVLDGDPNLPIGAAIAAQETEHLIAGVRQITRASGAGKAVIVLQQRLLPQVVSAIKKAGGITPLEIVNDYPQADPTILLASVFRRRLRPGRLPTDHGIVLLDAVAAVAVGRIVLRAQPMLHLPVALYNHSRNTTHLQTVPIGTSLEDVLISRKIPAGGYHFRGGDVLRDMRIPRDAVLGGAEIALHVSPGITPVNPDPCIRCGWCVESCPSHIHPAGLLDSAQRRDHSLAHHFGLDACVECGLCDYVCPSRLPILAGIRSMRKEEASSVRMNEE